MKRSISVLIASLLISLSMASAALAHEGHDHEESTIATTMSQTTMAQESTTAATGPLAPSGGPSVLLPAAALLLGAGLLSVAIMRRG